MAVTIIRCPTVSEQPYDLDGTTYRKVIPLFGPDTAERIVVGARYDSLRPARRRLQC